MINKITGFISLLLTCIVLAHMSQLAIASEVITQYQPDEELVAQSTPAKPLDAPVREISLPFSQIAPAGSMILRGSYPDSQVTFGMRSDEVASQALLSLFFTPSPALLPLMSQLKVYLNDELMGVITLTKEQLGKNNHIEMPLDPHYVSDFNQLRLELVGHYQDICENPANSALWLDIGKASELKLRLQTLALKNDLSHFPVPFFDSRDERRLLLPMVFAKPPSFEQQRSAAILASWFGSKSQWRGQSFPVLYNKLPDSHAIIFATNDNRPDFLRDYPQANGPTVEMINHPDSPYIKFLLIEGRDDNDLLTAVKGIAQGDILLRGQSVVIDKVQQLVPRMPYDAPNWVRTDRPMTFGELQQYKEQLQSSGIQPAPIVLTVNLPPDLFLFRSAGIDMNMKYRYTAPQISNGSRLSVNLNNQFIQAFSLEPEDKQSSLLLRLPLKQGIIDSDKMVTIPALRLGVSNQVRFDFEYTMLLSSMSPERCEAYSLTKNHVVIDNNSTIDFSGYRHFLAMPDLRVFASAGFPFSRMADLSQTLVLVNNQASPTQLMTLLNVLGNIGAQTGYPALNIQLSDDWAPSAYPDSDILMIGALPAQLRDRANASLLMDKTQSWVKQPMRQVPLPIMARDPEDARAQSQTSLRSEGALAAIVGVQSPVNPQRSIVALLADSPRGYQLLNEALADSGKRAAIFGSVAVIRESGVSSLRVGDVYYVGHLPWWERIWHLLATHPLWLALLAVVVVVIFGLLLWRVLKVLSRRRLAADE